MFSSSNRLFGLLVSVCIVTGSCSRAQLQPPAIGSGSDLLGMLSSLGPQLDNTQSPANLLSQMLQSGGSQSSSGILGQSQQGLSLAQNIGNLGNLLRAGQERSAKAVADVQTSGQQMAQQTADQAAGAQKGFQAALVEIGQGIQKIAAKNPTLVPDVKNLYQSVSSKFSSSSSSPSLIPGSSSSSDIVPARNTDQLLDNLAKVATKPNV